jgi:lysophospholipase L1-like esterase
MFHKNYGEDTMANILAFGDSNTWGLVPGTSERYPWGIRWTSIVQQKLSNERIIEEGLCGRTTVFDDKLRPYRNGAEVLPLSIETNYPIDIAIIMLVTNDCKKIFNASAHVIGKGLELCLDEAGHKELANAVLGKLKEMGVVEAA